MFYWTSVGNGLSSLRPKRLPKPILSVTCLPEVTPKLSWKTPVKWNQNTTVIAQENLFKMSWKCQPLFLNAGFRRSGKFSENHISQVQGRGRSFSCSFSVWTRVRQSTNIFKMKNIKRMAHRSWQSLYLWLWSRTRRQWVSQRQKVHIGHWKPLLP